MTEWRWTIAGAALLGGAAWFARSADHEARAHRPAEAEAPAPPRAPERARLVAGPAPVESRVEVASTDSPGLPAPRPPLVVRGSVTDRDGKPVPGAEVVLLRAGARGPDPGDVLERLLVDARGRFGWSARIEGDSIGVRVEACGFVPSDLVTCPVGSKDLRVVLTRLGWLDGRILTATDDWPDVRLWRDGKPVYVPSFGDLRDGRGRFQFGSVLPGTYSISYGYPWSAERAWVDGIRVESGRGNTDPRLDPLDVRALLPVVALTIVDREGRSVPGVEFWVYLSRSDEFLRPRPRRDGERWLVVGRPPLRIRVEAPGFRARELADVETDRRIVLERGIPVRVAVVGPLPDLPPGWELRGELSIRFLSPTAGSELPSHVREPSFSLAGGEAEVWLAIPGTYGFAFQIARGDRRGSFGDQVPLLVVHDDGTQQTFEVPAPSKAILQRMRAFVATMEGTGPRTFSR